MNIQTGAAIFSLLDQSLGLLKKAHDVMPDSKEKKELSKKLEEVEAAYKVAEAKAAKELGYDLCKCTWPPQIMLLGHDGRAECANCKRRGAGNNTQGDTAQATVTDSDIPPHAIKILQILARDGRDRPTASELAGDLKLRDQKVQYYLDLLKEQGLVDRTLIMGRSPMWYLTSNGRKLLVEMNLL